MNNQFPTHALVPLAEFQAFSDVCLGKKSEPVSGARADLIVVDDISPKLTYQVISADTPDELEEVVNANLDHGWQLQGGICSEPLGDFMQAMTKKEMVQ
ncbi:MAG: DUF1737 domain-containing protein [Alphaproteobacteria bacterium]|nr:DUF1737 domain-containing protein [Alphaproteobacteria bacterium]